MTTRSSTTESLLLLRLAQTTHTTVAKAISTDDAHISRFASGERGLRINQIGPALEAMGLKIVDINDATVPAKRLEALEYLAGESLGVTK